MTWISVPSSGETTVNGTRPVASETDDIARPRDTGDLEEALEAKPLDPGFVVAAAQTDRDGGRRRGPLQHDLESLAPDLEGLTVSRGGELDLDGEERHVHRGEDEGSPRVPV